MSTSPSRAVYMRIHPPASPELLSIQSDIVRCCYTVLFVILGPFVAFPFSGVVWIKGERLDHQYFPMHRIVGPTEQKLHSWQRSSIYFQQ